MPLPIKLYDLFKSKLADDTFEEKKIVDILAEVFDKADAKDKVQKANQEISSEREKLKEEIKAIKDALTQKEKELESVKVNALSEDEKKKIADLKSKGMTPENEAKFNSLMQKVQEFEETLKKERDARESNEKLLKESKKSERYQALKNKVIGALSEKRILGDNAKIALSFLESEGMIKLNENDDGTFSESFVIQKDGKPFDVKLEDLASEIATKHENLVMSSGRQGAGDSYTPSGNSMFNQPKTLPDLQSDAWANLKS